jgi:hypothetical protein
VIDNARPSAKTVFFSLIINLVSAAWRLVNCSEAVTLLSCFELQDLFYANFRFNALTVA